MNIYHRQSAAYRQILELINKLPNDQALGQEVRKLMHEYQKPYFNHEHSKFVNKKI